MGVDPPMAQTRIVIPKTAQKGEIIRIKTLIQHVMETGHRRDRFGNVVSRDLVNRLTVTYGGRMIFRAELNPGLAANPFFAFSTRARESGDIVFEWQGDNGFLVRETRQLAVL
jgi:sulfur-oxidizing protein SoxZ